MKNLILLLSVVVTAFTTLITTNKEDSISVLYSYAVKDKMLIIGEFTGNIELDGYHNTLTNKFKEELKRYYKNITISEKLPETGKVLVVRSIEPRLIMKEGRTKCSILYNCEVWQDKKQVRKFSDTISNDYPGENLNHDKTMALISYTHQDMIKKIAHEVR
jgi:hypothetical protein